MPSYYSKLEDLINNGKNFNKIIFFLVVFLCVIKLPALVSTDIQPWDEGMYATRVLSIHAHGDFFDQSAHSVGRFYSGSHPPLLIWAGYLSTLVFGNNSVSFKIIPLLFSLLSVILIMFIGKRLFDQRTSIFAAMIFSSNIVFNVLSKRFQLDIPYTFFILLSFYCLFIFNDTVEKKYLILSGISFGLCLMTKILVGFYIPIVLLLSYFFIKGKVNFRFKDIAVITLIGIAIALPWHWYMFSKFGNEFTDYFIKFHVYDRVVEGVEQNEKSSGIFFYVNYLLSIIPFSILILFGFLKDARNYSSLNWKKIFIWVWFIIGFIIISVFKTKLETYSLLILMPACFLISLAIENMDKNNLKFKTIAVLLVFANLVWFATESMRPELKLFASAFNKGLLVIMLIVVTGLFFFISKFLAEKIKLNNFYYTFIFIFFLAANFYYLFQIPVWENKYEISELKDHVDKSQRKNLIYIGAEEGHNPQFSYYFEGLDLKWRNEKYNFTFVDSKEPLSQIKEDLSKLKKHESIIVIERDGIQRGQYPDTKFFMPDDINLIMKSTGYELYEN